VLQDERKAPREIAVHVQSFQYCDTTRPGLCRCYAADIPFYSIPITTNVGTTLEPWFRDYGVAGVLIGILVVSFGVDLIAYWGLKFGRVTGTMVAVVMCFCSTLAFFVPRLTSGAVLGALLIFFLHFVCVAIRQLAPRKTTPLSPQTS
jgi:hypothetical protein